jgi:hypothetical protein
MLNKQVIHCFNYFKNIETLKNKHSETMFVSYFDTLKNIFENTKDNSFAQKNIIFSFYSKIKTETINISDFIEDDIMLSFFKDYNSFTDSFFSKYENDLNKIKNKFEEIINLDTIINDKELLSYCVTESLIEYSKANIKFIPRINNDNIHYSNKIHFSIHSVKKELDILTILENKSFGFYIFKVPYQKVTGNSFKSANAVCLVSHQSNGTTLFNLDNIVLGRSGLKGNSITLENIVSKNHKINIELKENTKTELSTNTKELNEFYSLPIFNQLTIISLAGFCSLKEERDTNEAKIDCLIAYKNNQNDKSFLPVISNFTITDLPYITFEELKFKGKYLFLSKLDDLFEDIINMEFVNFKSDKSNCYFELTMNNENDVESEFGNYFNRSFEPKVFSKHDFNQFYIKETNFKDAGVGTETSKGQITPLNNSIIGTKEEIYNHCFQKAKMNKLTLYVKYIRFYTSINQDKFTTEMWTFINDNIEVLLNDSEFLSLINSVGLCRNSKRNYHNAAYGNCVLISKEQYNINNLEELNGFNSNKKASHLISIILNNTEFYDLFINKYNLTLSKESLFYIELYKMNVTLDKIFDSIEMVNKKKMVFFGFIDNNIDLELQNWYSTFPPLSLILPTTTKQQKDLIFKFEKLDINIKDTSYSTGRSFYPDSMY